MVSDDQRRVAVLGSFGENEKSFVMIGHFSMTLFFIDKLLRQRL
jgi:hypothetical protein